jgi:lipoate-protein ligase A
MITPLVSSEYPIIPMRYSEDTNGVFRRYQWSDHKIPMGYSEDTNGVFRRYQWSDHKIPMGYSEDTNGIL